MKDAIHHRCVKPDQKQILFEKLTNDIRNLKQARSIAEKAERGSSRNIAPRVVTLEDLPELRDQFSKLPPCFAVEAITRDDGTFIAFEITKQTGIGGYTERLATTAEVTNFLKATGDPLGVGGALGYKFALPGSSVAVAPFVAFEWPNIAVNHTFANGSFLGTKSNFEATAGVKIGPRLAQGIWLYGIAGVSGLNETLNVNFIPVASSKNATVGGATVGAGAAWAFRPNFMQGFGKPVSMFLEYEHTWWQDAHFDTPAASPFFNYTLRREDDVVKLGFMVFLDAPASVSTYPVKAPRSK
jgi:hypothetical protein